MKRFFTLIIAVVFATALSAQNVQDWTQTSCDGNYNITLFNELAAGKCCLLDFFFTTCPPCIQSVPILEQIWQDYGAGAGNVMFFGLDVQSETCATINTWATGMNKTYPDFDLMNSEYWFYATPRGWNGVPAFILLDPNITDPANSTVIWDQEGWGTNQEDNEIRTALGNAGFFPTGIAATLKEKGVAVYPNPAVTEFNVYLTENADVQIFNMAGQLVESQDNVTSSLNVNTTNYDAGMYIVKVNEQTFKVSVLK